ncbi:hypothetical protein [Desulfovibrio inopinatus]|uniref:hypothetical protein n=1 Tax=Desulfovibrio inopinatus TaxID=102109 RepID=UPI00040DBE3C|nr:hypothetical protein [Desulfovibrio inopinatus]
MITVIIEPDENVLTFPRLNTVLQLLGKLGFKRNDALVIREGELLTPDRKFRDGDTIRIRPVMSRG